MSAFTYENTLRYCTICGCYHNIDITGSCPLPTDSGFGDPKDGIIAQLRADNARLTTQHETDKKLIVEHIKRESHYIPTVANLQKAVEEAERVIKECEWAIKYQDMGEHDCEACPICHNEYKHSPSCELGLWLTKYGRQE